MANCKWCDDEIYFEKDEHDKWKPMDYETNEIHRCSERPGSNYSQQSYTSKPVLCNYCNERIVFSSKVKSPSGKFVPLEYDALDPTFENTLASDIQKHSCEQNPYNSKFKEILNRGKDFRKNNKGNASSLTRIQSQHNMNAK